MSQSNLQRFKGDLKRLIASGDLLVGAYQYLCDPEPVKKRYSEVADSEKDKERKLELQAMVKLLEDTAANFTNKYEEWYSEALAVVRQLLPDREAIFRSLYEKPKSARKKIDFDNYVIQDGIHGLRATFGYESVTDRSAALPKLAQQVGIIKSAERRFESSLFDIRTIVQADLLDSEIDSAQELLRHKFTRAAGAICGVVLEKHLESVGSNHNLKSPKKNPGISDWNDLLKAQDVIDTPKWRQIQRLGDIRNLCDHKKDRDPTEDEVQDLVDGTKKVIKTIF